MAFKARTTAPSTSSKYWKHTSAGGVNSCLLIGKGSVLPNCVGYAWGRFYEILGSKPKLSRRNAELWYGYTADGYKRGKKPKLGAVVCWAKGKVGNSKDGVGHVAIVEKIYKDGSFLVSQSGYGSKRFWTSKIPSSGYIKDYVLQGFIYNPAVKETVSTMAGNTTSAKRMKCVAKSGLKIRSGAGTKYSQVGSVKYGESIAVTTKVTEGSNTWYKCGKGYVCAKQGSNVYLK